MLKNCKHITMYEAVSASSVSVVDASVTGFVEQKIKYWPSDEFLFIIEIFWSDKRTTYVKRCYREFEIFHDLLKQHFLSKYQSGIIKAPVYIPFIQGRRLFRMNSRELAEEREMELNTFLKHLIPGNVLVTSNNIVLDFFKSRPTDPKSDSEACVDSAADTKDNNEEDDEDVLFDR